jgi:hypothetical protein
MFGRGRGRVLEKLQRSDKIGFRAIVARLNRSDEQGLPMRNRRWK